MQDEQPWTVGGTYEVTGQLLGVSDTFRVTIKENPIKELQLIKMPDKTEYIQGEQINLKGAIIRIKYTDGSFEDFEIDHDFTSVHRKSIYSNKLNKESGLRVSGNDNLGMQKAEVYLFNELCEVPMIVLENQMESISISETADKFIVATVNSSDNTSYEMTLLDISYCWWLDDGIYAVGLFTDKGEFSAIVYADEESFAIELYDSISEKRIKSNVLPTSEWFKAARASYLYSWSIVCNYDCKVLETEHYNGMITAENIDDIVSFAVYNAKDEFDYEWDVLPTGEECMVLSGNTVREAVKEAFGIENVDLTLSQNYDNENDIYKTTKFEKDGGEEYKCSPSKISYSNGVWSVESTHAFYQEHVVYIELNNNQQIVSFDIDEKHTEHEDYNEDGLCDECDKVMDIEDPSGECECNCHKSGLTKFFFKFILFFQRLFGSNKACACGVAHY